MNQFKFYYNWLKTIFIAMLVTSIYLAFFNQSEYFVFKNAINSYFWDQGTMPDMASAKFQGFIYGLMGATMAAWSVLMLFVLKHSFRQKQKWAWNAIAMSIAVWFPIDEFFSIYYGIYFNAIYNVLLLFLIVLPLALVRKHFGNNS